MRNLHKVFFRLLLCLALAAVLLPGTVNPGAAKAEGDKTISGLGVGTITNPIGTDRSKVYYGSKGSILRFNVLQNNETHFGGTTMLLDCDGLVEERQLDANTVNWKDTALRSYLNGTFLNNRFTATEQSAIARSTKTQRAEGYDGNANSSSNANYIWQSLEGDRIFILGGHEASNTNYGFKNDYYQDKARDKGGDWWLRTHSINYHPGLQRHGDRFLDSRMIVAQGISFCVGATTFTVGAPHGAPAGYDLLSYMGGRRNELHPVKRTRK